MDDKSFEVEVVSRHRTVYHVCARDATTAEKVATARWQAGEPGDIPGLDESEVMATRIKETEDSIRQAQDVELILRFLRERERQILEGNLTTASINDAISAHQTADGLGWHEQDVKGEHRVDTARAARALDRLCTEKKVACFLRQMVRAGERGEVPLYCTPHYLDRLSALVNGEIAPSWIPRVSSEGE
ncbi:MAG: hypothetical protein GEU90_08240 [Gemmatimonas sp.]|nr:hypothetical protein [Gemmatimonas sp.]